MVSNEGKKHSAGNCQCWKSGLSIDCEGVNCLQISAILAMFFTAELCQIRLLDGWPFAFYVYGTSLTLFVA
jgi:hypothetical protein